MGKIGGSALTAASSVCMGAGVFGGGGGGGGVERTKVYELLAKISSGHKSFVIQRSSTVNNMSACMNWSVHRVYTMPAAIETTCINLYM